MAPVGPLGEVKVLEVEDLRPRIPEICNPAYAGILFYPFCNKVHGVGRAGAYDYINVVLLYIFGKEFHAWTDPELAGIGYKEVSPHKKRNLM